MTNYNRADLKRILRLCDDAISWNHTVIARWRDEDQPWIGFQATRRRVIARAKREIVFAEGYKRQFAAQLERTGRTASRP